MRLRSCEVQLEPSDRIAHFVFAEIGDAQEKIHVGIVRIVGEHLFETLDGLWEFQFGLLKYAETLKGFKMAWGKRQRLQVDTFRRLVISRLFSRTRLFEKGSYLALRAGGWRYEQDTGNQGEKNGPEDVRHREAQTARQVTNR